MYNAGNGWHYFIDEPAGLRDGRMVIPVRWLEDESGTVYCDAWEIKLDKQTVSVQRTQRTQTHNFKTRTYQKSKMRKS